MSTQVNGEETTIEVITKLGVEIMGKEESPVGTLHSIEHSELEPESAKKIFTEDSTEIINAAKTLAKQGSEKATQLLESAGDVKIFPVGPIIATINPEFAKQMERNADILRKFISAVQLYLLSPEGERSYTEMINEQPLMIADAIRNYRTEDNLAGLHVADDHYIDPNTGKISILEINFGAAGGDKEAALVEVALNTALNNSNFEPTAWTSLVTTNKELAESAYNAWARANSLEPKQFEDIGVVGLAPDYGIFFGRQKLWKDMEVPWCLQDCFEYDKRERVLYALTSQGRRKVDLILLGDIASQIDSPDMWQALADNAVAIDSSPLTILLEDKRLLSLLRSEESAMVLTQFGISKEEVEALVRLVEQTYSPEELYELENGLRIPVQELITHPAYGALPNIALAESLAADGLDNKSLPDFVIKQVGTFGGHGVTVLPNRAAHERDWFLRHGIHDPKEPGSVIKVQLIKRFLESSSNELKNAAKHLLSKDLKVVKKRAQNSLLQGNRVDLITEEGLPILYDFISWWESAEMGLAIKAGNSIDELKEIGSKINIGGVELNISDLLRHPCYGVEASPEILNTLLENDIQVSDLPHLEVTLPNGRSLTLINWARVSKDDPNRESFRNLTGNGQQIFDYIVNQYLQNNLNERAITKISQELGGEIVKLSQRYAKSGSSGGAVYMEKEAPIFVELLKFIQSSKQILPAAVQRFVETIRTSHTRTNQTGSLEYYYLMGRLNLYFGAQKESLYAGAQIAPMSWAILDNRHKYIVPIC